MYVKYAFQSKQELREILTVCSRWRMKDSFIFLIFLCVRIEIIRASSDLLLNISLSVGQSYMDKSFALRAHDLFTLTTDLQPVIY